MKLLIIGKNGQVGSSLVKELKSQDIAFYATAREELDITQKKAVDDFFNACHDVDFVINAAAYTHVDVAEQEHALAKAGNEDAVRYLAEACSRFHLPMIHISTDYVFDGLKKTGYTEEDTPNPKNVYGLTKLNGENALRSILKEYIILRVSWVFSEYGKNFVKTMAALSESKDKLSVVCDQFGSPTSAASIARVIIHLCRTVVNAKNAHAYWGIYHFTDFPVTNWHQLATYVIRAKHPKKKIEIKAIEGKDYPTVAQRPPFSILNTQKIQNVFGVAQNLWASEIDHIIERI
jgi:dTDP-4-dehydrorhamnose reductase